MNLDVNTLFMVTVYVEAMLGLLLLFAWVQNLAVTAVAWWGWAHLLRAASIAMFGMYGAVFDLISIDLANALLFMSFAATWTGARVFDGRPVSMVGLFAGAVLWIGVSRLPAVAASVEIRTFLSSGIIVAYTWLAAYEFWRGRDEPLVSRWPAVFMLFSQGALFLLHTPLNQLLPWIPDRTVFESVWMTALSFEGLLFTISVAFILLAMAKERTEFLHKTASLIDPLTGLANRRAFMEGSQELVQRIRSAPCSAGVLLIDLDRFKSVNDNFGHALGDRVLQIFAKTANAHLGPSDLIGRLGGEEFAVILYDADHDRALAVAEEIRNAFANNARRIDGQDIGATASVGVAVSREGIDLSDLLAQADQALYLAKQRGRNRVESASLDLMLKLDNSTPSLRIPELAAKSAA